MKTMRFVPILCLLAGLTACGNSGILTGEQIDQMYSEAAALSQSNTKSCKHAEITEYQQFAADLDPAPFSQSVEYCQLDNGYSLYTCTFRGHEWEEVYNFYLKDSKLFYAFLDGAAEACYYQNTIRYNPDGTIIDIKQLANPCNASDEMKPVALDKQDEKRLTEGMKESFEKALKMIK